MDRSKKNCQSVPGTKINAYQPEQEKKNSNVAAHFIELAKETYFIDRNA